MRLYKQHQSLGHTELVKKCVGPVKIFQNSLIRKEHNIFVGPVKIYSLSLSLINEIESALYYCIKVACIHVYIYIQQNQIFYWTSSVIVRRNLKNNCACRENKDYLNDRKKGFVFVS